MGKTWNIIVLLAAIGSFAYAIYNYCYLHDYQQSCHWLMVTMLLTNCKSSNSENNC